MGHLLNLSTIKLDIIHRILFLVSVCAAQVTITRPPENRTVNRGDDVTISCGYDSATALSVTWIINGTSFTQQEIVNNPLYRLNNPTSPPTLSLTVFSISATTTFQCIVQSTPVITSTRGTIIVFGNVTITTPPENRTVNRGDDVTVTCGYQWATALPVTWIINGRSFNQQEIVNSPLYQLNNPTSPPTLSLTVFSINATTTFQCVVLSTPNTTTSIRGTVTVTDKLTPIMVTANVSFKINTIAITVSWQIITGCAPYITMYNITVMDQYSPAIVTVPANMLSFEISQFPYNNGTSIVANREYTITVSAINNQGTSYPSDPIIVDTFILQNCGVTSPSFGTIRVSCDSSHQIQVTALCVDVCSRFIVTSNGYSPLTMGLDPGERYTITINVFNGNQVVFNDKGVAKSIRVINTTSIIITTPPENTIVCRGNHVTISCGYLWISALPVTWIINGTSFTQEELWNSPLYQLNNPTSPTTLSLTVFSINGTTTFQCVVLSTPVTISTRGTVTVTSELTPIMVTANKINTTAITVSWQIIGCTAANITMYNITVMDQYSPAIVTVPANMLSAEISQFPYNGTSIVANREYKITVSAISDQGTSYPSDPVVVDTFILQNCEVTSPSIGTIRVSCDSSHQIQINAICLNNCNYLLVTSNGYSPLTVMGLDPGKVYTVIINVFDSNQVVLNDESIIKAIIVTNTTSIMYTTTSSTATTTTIYTTATAAGTTAVASDICNACTSAIENLDESGLSTGSVAVVTSAVTFILTLTITVIITFIVTYVCVKRTLDKASTHNLKHHTSGPQEKVLYEQVRLPSHTVTKNDLELQPNPAYGTSHKVTMDTNPAYESCK